ncbi:uncharacterized protein LOC122197199 isoform X1 [Lactuca sativa]|uniref:GAG-pre-integrase domain-containing protein n=1 Tax=Lactuca sativa TaxID=4236 RepID=A0A9R1W384_LACSA|nr:uncharacterized protein LOC122197199 isoform X1 [Lactuca sativa]KAJ0215415.1 hypothetical protein LSAT_V11C300147530 [Lactuca sativa]
MVNPNNPLNNGILEQTSSNDPFYIHHSVNLGSILVSQVLTGENHASRSSSMKITLLAKNKFDFVDDTIPQPDVTDPEKLKLWLRNNNIIILWILNIVSKEIYASIIYLETTSAIWKELCARFQQNNGPRIFKIKRNLMNLTQGFPHGYRTNFQGQSSKINVATIDTGGSQVQNPIGSENNDVVTRLTNEQCQQIIAMLSGKLESVNVVSSKNTPAGNHFILTLNEGLFKSNVWILDSGATSHVCNNKDMFHNMRYATNTRIRLPNQLLIQVEKVGSIKLNDQLVLQDVLFVPQFELNLVYVNSLTAHDKDLMVNLYHDHAIIKHISNNSVIGNGEVLARLYVLKVEEVQGFASVVTTQRWNQRLGHPSFNKIKCLDNVLNCGNHFTSNLCTVCPIAKQKR